MKPDFFLLQAVLCMYIVYCDICHNDLSVKSLLPAWYYTSINVLKTGCWFVNVISLFSQATFTCVISINFLKTGCWLVKYHMTCQSSTYFFGLISFDPYFHISEQFDDIKGIIRSSKLKDIQCNDQRITDERRNNDILKTRQKTKDEVF
jgi:hypothetical protein